MPLRSCAHNDLSRFAHILLLRNRCVKADVCLLFPLRLSRRGPPRALRDEHRQRQRQGGPPGKGPPPGYRGPGQPRDGFPPGTMQDVVTIPSVVFLVAHDWGSNLYRDTTARAFAHHFETRWTSLTPSTTAQEPNGVSRFRSYLGA